MRYAFAPILALILVTPAFAEGPTCTGRGAVITCTGPAVTNSPAEAVAILRGDPLPPPLAVTIVTQCGPTVAQSGHQVQPDNMSGPWDWPAERPARRLDGTLLSDPVTTYGAVPWFILPQPIVTPQRRPR